MAEVKLCACQGCRKQAGYCGRGKQPLSEFLVMCVNHRTAARQYKNYTKCSPAQAVEHIKDLAAKKVVKSEQAKYKEAASPVERSPLSVVAIMSYVQRSLMVVQGLGGITNAEKLAIVLKNTHPAS